MRRLAAVFVAAAVGAGGVVAAQPVAASPQLPVGWFYTGKYFYEDADCRDTGAADLDQQIIFFECRPTNWIWYLWEYRKP